MHQFIKDKFANLSDLCKKVYGGKEVVYIVPSKKSDRIVVSDPSVMVIKFPEAEVNYNQIRSIAYKIIQSEWKKLLVITQSPVLLSDAFQCQILTFNGAAFHHFPVPTFGASPDRIACHCWNGNAFGLLAEDTLRGWLADPPPRDELEQICQSVGTGYHGAKLQSLLDDAESPG